MGREGKRKGNRKKGDEIKYGSFYNKVIYCWPSHLYHHRTQLYNSRWLWSCGIWHTAAAGWLLGSSARIPLRACICVCCVCCVCCVDSGLCDDLITRSEKSYRVCVCVCVLETSTVKRSKLELGFISVFNQLDAQNLFHSKFYFMPLHVSSTCVRNM